jgi:3-dehydroquinate dehydratase type II
MKFLILNGPNLNMLGVREPDIYGHATLADLEKMIRVHCAEIGAEVEFFQSNHEGALVDAIQAAYGKIDCIVINPAAYTHTSVAIPDALKAVGIPAVEVHLSDIDSREEFRRHSYTSAACVATVKGKHFAGFVEAIDLLAGNAGALPQTPLKG